jgi:hypothetical protein
MTFLAAKTYIETPRLAKWCRRRKAATIYSLVLGTDFATHITQNYFFAMMVIAMAS